MRRSVIAIAVITVLIFGIGYLVGQLRAPTLGAAAGTAPSGPHGFLHPFVGVHNAGPRAGGQVTNISGNTYTVKPWSTPWGQQSSVTSIVVNGSTKFARGFGSAATQSDVKTGTYILARGSLSSDGKTLTATQVYILPGAPGHGAPFAHPIRPHADGIVAGISGNTVTLKADTGHFGFNESNPVKTVVLTDTTRYIAAPGATAGKSAIKTGAFIVATGTLSSDGKTLTATRVIIGGHGSWAGPAGRWGTPRAMWGGPSGWGPAGHAWGPGSGSLSPQSPSGSSTSA
jgi:hypothetical protein